MEHPLERNDFARWLLCIWLAGVVVRVAFLWLEPPTTPIADERTWTNWAIENLLSDRVGLNPFRTRMIFYPPVYPYFIALAYAPFGTLAAVKVAQILFGSLLIPALGRIGASLFGRSTGLAAASVVALYPDHIWYSVHFWSEIIFLPLLWWAFERVFAADRDASLRAAIAAGALWGVSILTRETVLYLTPLVAVWLAWGRAAAGRRLGIAFLLAAAVAVVPWTYRNYRVFDGAFVPVSTAGGLNLWQGNARLKREEVYVLYDQVGGRVNQYRYARQKGLEAIWERQPTWLFEKLRDEMPRFWEADSLAMIHTQRGAYGPVRPEAALVAAVVIVAPYVALLLFAIVGTSALRPDRRHVLLLGFLALYNGLHVVTHGFARYRMPIMPIVILFASAAFIAWRRVGWPMLTAKRRALALALALAFAAVLMPSLRSHWNDPTFDLDRSPELPARRGTQPAIDAATSR